MTADEINEGLNRYVWPENIAFMEREGIAIDWVRFTDSLDACERVADKLGVLEFTSFIWEPDAEYKAVAFRAAVLAATEGKEQ